MSFTPLSMCQHPPLVHPGGYLHYGDTYLSPEQETAPVYHPDQTTGGHLFAAEVATTTSNCLYHCKWLTGGIHCGQCFITFDALVVHLGHMHDVQGSAQRKLVCHWWTHRGYCGNEYRRDAFRRHIATHLNFSVSCNYCNKSFSRVDSLHSHMKKKHTRELLPTVP